MTADKVPNTVMQRVKGQFGQDEHAISLAGRLNDLCSAQTAEIRSILPRDEAESSSRRRARRRRTSLAGRALGSIRWPRPSGAASTSMG